MPTTLLCCNWLFVIYRISDEDQSVDSLVLGQHFRGSVGDVCGTNTKWSQSVHLVPLHRGSLTSDEHTIGDECNRKEVSKLVDGDKPTNQKIQGVERV